MRHGEHAAHVSGPLIIAVGLLMIALIVAGGYVLGAFKSASATDQVVRHLVYTAPTANAATITLPATIKGDLESVGLAHQMIAVSRIEGDGQTSTSVIDLTPRTGDSAGSPPITVESRALPRIDEKLASIEASINSPARTAGQALYVGLTRIEFINVPTILVSTGIDLADPTDFRKLGWAVPPDQILAAVQQAGVQPVLRGPVTFVTVPTAGAQAQLGQAERDYRKAAWTALLVSAGSSNVTFIDSETGPTPSNGPTVPIVPAMPLPGTPIQPVTNPTTPTTVTCTIPGSYFVVNSPVLIDADKTVHDLSSCVGKAVASGAAFRLDGWTSYDGPLTADGKPAKDDSGNRALSQQRIDTIANLLVSRLQVKADAITTKVPHGNMDQPYPADPRSELNRTVLITYST